MRNNIIESKNYLPHLRPHTSVFLATKIMSVISHRKGKQNSQYTFRSHSLENIYFFKMTGVNATKKQLNI